MHAQIGFELSILRDRELRERAARGKPVPSPRRPPPLPPVDRS
jgi:hypothetical protein